MTANIVRNLKPYLDAWIDYRVWRSQTPGLQVAIRVKDELLHSAGYGVADLASGEPLKTSHLFRVASHSKLLSAVACMRLVQLGRLSLEDTVGKLAPTYASTAAAEATLGELLSHTAGLVRDGRQGSFWVLDEDFPNPGQLLARVTESGKAADVAEMFRYSNFGFGIVGLILENVTGKSYADAMRDIICKPLGLDDTSPDWTSGLQDQMASAHGPMRGEKYERSTLNQVETGALAAATGFVSTAEDISLAVSTLTPFVDGVLTDVACRRMLRPRGCAEEHGKRTEYGLGVIIPEVGGRKVYGHTGGWPGMLSATFTDPTDGLTVSVLGNSVDTPALPVNRSIFELVSYAKRPLESWQSTPDGVDLSTFEGRYESLWGTVDIVQLGDQLVEINAGAPEVGGSIEPLTVVDRNTLRAKDRDTFGGSGEDYVFEFSGSKATMRSCATVSQRVCTW